MPKKSDSTTYETSPARRLSRAMRDLAGIFANVPTHDDRPRRQRLLKITPLPEDKSLRVAYCQRVRASLLQGAKELVEDAQEAFREGGGDAADTVLNPGAKVWSVNLAGLLKKVDDVVIAEMFLFPGGGPTRKMPNKWLDGSAEAMWTLADALDVAAEEIDAAIAIQNHTLHDAEPTDLINQESAARIAGVTAKTIRDWINKGKLKGYGSHRMVCKSKLEKKIKDGTLRERSSKK